VTKRDAQSALTALGAGIEEGSVPHRSEVTLGEFLDDWILVQKERVRATTWHSYAMAVERIKRYLGMAKLQALSPLQIEKFYSTLLKSGRSGGGALAAKTVRNTHVVLRPDDLAAVGFTASPPTKLVELTVAVDQVLTC
jgi:hypothetical protein